MLPPHLWSAPLLGVVQVAARLCQPVRCVRAPPFAEGWLDRCAGCPLSRLPSSHIQIKSNRLRFERVFVRGVSVLRLRTDSLRLQLPAAVFRQQPIEPVSRFEARAHGAGWIHRAPAGQRVCGAERRDEARRGSAGRRDFRQGSEELSGLPFVPSTRF